MQLFGIRVFEQQEIPTRRPFHRSSQRLRAVAAAMLTLAAGMPPGFAQQTAPTVTDKAASALPAAPAPLLTQPPTLRQSMRNYSKPAGRTWGDPIKWFMPTSIPKASFQNSVRLGDLMKNGNIYLSLSDALALALENNYDLAIARYNLDIADTDILRTRTGATPLGAPAGLVTNTLGGASATLTAGGGPGGTSVGAGGAGSGTSGLSLTTQGAGPLPETFEPSISANIQFDRQRQVSTSFFTGGTSTTNTYDFTYDQGFETGTALQFAFNNTYATTSNPITLFSPELNSNFKVTLTQHVLQGAGIWVNKRFIYQAINDRRITNSAFRQQILYTVNQVENIYWGLVSAYEDVQAKDRALQQSTQLLSDDQKQLQIGTMAPLDVVNAESQVATDRQALISSQNTLNYQQQIIKQAIARNLNDQALERAPVIPTDRVSIGQLPEESQPLENLVQQAFRNRPELEQAVLTLKNDEITLKGARNALLPKFDVYGYLGGAGVAGSINPNCNGQFYGGTCPVIPATGWTGSANNAFNNSSPDKGIGFNIAIPLGNKLAQSVQARSIMEFRQAELHLEQLYTEIRMQVVNAQFALTNERALVNADVAAEQYAQQSYDDEVKKLHLGASTTANVLQQERNLAVAENNLIAAKAGYANARASLFQTLATTLEHYGINMQEASSGTVGASPVVPGLTPAAAEQQPATAPAAQ
ncbi:MAG TPA: TolC family protein [Terracidiphilus sp.]|nr:TolC family protein [Terracidiphilus sp.]